MSPAAGVTVRPRQVDSTTSPSAAVDKATSLDPESREWLRCLRGHGRERDEAVARLHALLLRAARFECARRRPTLPHLRGNDLDDIANQAADDALVSVLGRLDSFRGASRFTTWAYKFAVLEAAVKLRRRAWQGARGPARAGDVEPLLRRRHRAGCLGRAERAPRHAAGGDRGGVDAPPAACARCAGAERRADRRPRRAPEHDARRALQDAARRPPQAARHLEELGLSLETLEEN